MQDRENSKLYHLSMKSFISDYIQIHVFKQVQKNFSEKSFLKILKTQILLCMSLFELLYLYLQVATYFHVIIYNTPMAAVQNVKWRQSLIKYA